MARKIKIAPSTKSEMKVLVENYFAKGGTIKVYPVRYATGYLRATLTCVTPAKK